MKAVKYLFLLAIIFCLGCPEEEILIEKDIPSLKDVFKDDFYIGAAIEPFQFQIPAYRQLLKKHFSSITAENVMKPKLLQPEEGRFEFGEADKIVDFARNNGMAVRGHTLIWHQQVPVWFFSENGVSASKEKLKERMKTHITQIMQRYKGQIYAWDVVNEAIDPNAQDGFRKTRWFEILGEEYIELAFRYAREADPDAKLFYNDYDTTDSKKRRLIINLVKKLQTKGVPIDGIGMQMHISLTKPSLYDFEDSLKDFSELGLEIHITEMDITVYEDKKESFSTISQEMLNEQGHRVKDLFTIIKKYKKYITSVTFWGMTDDHTWLASSSGQRNDWPLPFDKTQKAKPFYWGMVDPKKLIPRINKEKVIEGTPVIDGKEDEIWQLAESFPDLPVLEALSLDAKALWDKKNLYILLKVADASPGKGDAIAFFIDEKNEKTDSLDENDRVIEFILDDSWKNSKNAVFYPADGGYIFETLIPFEHIEGSKIITMGFDMQVKNGDGGLIKWNDQDVTSGLCPKNWGVLKFAAAAAGAVAYFGNAVIDGIKDAKYNAGKPLLVKKFIQGGRDENSLSKGASAKVWILWDETALYVYAEVTDSKLSVASELSYMQDSIEVFIDENNNKTAFYEKDDAQYRINYKNDQFFGSNGSSDGFQSAAKVRAGGYAIELKIPFRNLRAKEGTVIGFDFQINDDQGSGKRDSITKWNDVSNNSYQSTAGFGVLLFKK